MIFGGCPYCDAPQANPYCGHAALQKITCDDCGKDYWLRHSTFDPEAYTAEQFAERYELNEGTKSVVDRRQREADARRAADPEKAKAMDKLADYVAQKVADRFVHELLYGSPVSPGEGSFYIGGGLSSLLTEPGR